MGQVWPQVQREPRSLDLTVGPSLLPAPVPSQCWGQWGSAFGPGFSAQVAQTEGPKAQRHQSHPYRIPFLPSPGNGGSVTSVQGSRPEEKVHAGAFDLASPIPVGTKPGCYSAAPAGVDPDLRGQHSRAHVQDPYIPAWCSHSSQAGACPACAGHTRMYTHTQAPHPTPHAYLPT